MEIGQGEGVGEAAVDAVTLNIEDGGNEKKGDDEHNAARTSERDAMKDDGGSGGGGGRGGDGDPSNGGKPARRPPTIKVAPHRLAKKVIQATTRLQGAHLPPIHEILGTAKWWLDLFEEEDSDDDVDDGQAVSSAEGKDEGGEGRVSTGDAKEGPEEGEGGIEGGGGSEDDEKMEDEDDESESEDESEDDESEEEDDDDDSESSSEEEVSAETAKRSVQFELKYDLTDHRLRRIYHRYDRDNDNCLTFQELCAGLRETGVSFTRKRRDKLHKIVLALLMHQRRQEEEVGSFDDGSSSRGDPNSPRSTGSPRIGSRGLPAANISPLAPTDGVGVGGVGGSTGAAAAAAAVGAGGVNLGGGDGSGGGATAGHVGGATGDDMAGGGIIGKTRRTVSMESEDTWMAKFSLEECNRYLAENGVGFYVFVQVLKRMKMAQLCRDLLETHHGVKHGVKHGGNHGGKHGRGKHRRSLYRGPSSRVEVGGTPSNSVDEKKRTRAPTEPSEKKSRRVISVRGGTPLWSRDAWGALGAADLCWRSLEGAQAQRGRV